MAKEILINPQRCIGCTTCALTCSITYGEDFKLSRSFVQIQKDDFNGLFTIAFSSACKGCKKCAEVCPSGALRVIELSEEVVS